MRFLCHRMSFCIALAFAAFLFGCQESSQPAGEEAANVQHDHDHDHSHDHSHGPGHESDGDEHAHPESLADALAEVERLRDVIQTASTVVAVVARTVVVAA